MENITKEVLKNLPNMGYHAPKEAAKVQNNFKRYFISPSSLVDWQWDNITNMAHAKKLLTII